MLTDDELQEIERAGEKYCAALGATLDEIKSVEARVHLIRIIFSSVLTQILERRGPGETVAFLRRMIERIEADARERMQ